MVLGALVLPHSTVAVVVNGEGRLGVAHDLFAPPSYTTALLARLPKGKWRDIYLLLSDREKRLEVYLNNRRVIATQWLEPVFPVQQIWLGALWLKGAGNYGAPLDVSELDPVWWTPPYLEYRTSYESKLLHREPGSHS